MAKNKLKRAIKRTDMTFFAAILLLLFTESGLNVMMRLANLLTIIIISFALSVVLYLTMYFKYVRRKTKRIMVAVMFLSLALFVEASANYIIAETGSIIMAVVTAGLLILLSYAGLVQMHKVKVI